MQFQFWNKYVSHVITSKHRFNFRLCFHRFKIRRKKNVPCLRRQIEMNLLRRPGSAAADAPGRARGSARSRATEKLPAARLWTGERQPEAARGSQAEQKLIYADFRQRNVRPLHLKQGCQKLNNITNSHVFLQISAEKICIFLAQIEKSTVSQNSDTTSARFSFKLAKINQIRYSLLIFEEHLATFVPIK